MNPNREAHFDSIDLDTINMLSLNTSYSNYVLKIQIKKRATGLDR